MQVKIDFNSSLSSIVGIGPTYLKKLDTIGLKTVRDLLFYFPFRYEDLSNEQKIINLEKGSVVNIVATVWQITKFRTKTGKILVKAVINDSTGSLECVWFNQNYLLSVLKPNQVVSFSGKVDVFNNKLTLVNPKFEHIKKGFELVHTKGLVPVYSESGGISARWLRSKIFHLISLLGKDFPETLPSKLLIEEKLVSLGEALKQIHFPKSNESLVESRERLSFEELFFLQLRNLQSKKEQFKDQKAPIIKLENVDKFYKLLSFELTVSQKKAIEEILSDLSKTQPMNRLLQGEVGSGKTIVSAAALFATAENGFQAAFMAPTEILAKQHFENLKSLLGQKYSVELAVAGSKISEKKFDIVVGTHALLQKNIEFKNLALVVVDEQQRFGVSQRKILREKGRNVHYLTMTATPIPRTLALTMNGDLKISTLEEFPFGKKKIRTYLVPSYKRPKAYEFIRKKFWKERRYFWSVL